MCLANIIASYVVRRYIASNDLIISGGEEKKKKKSDLVLRAWNRIITFLLRFLSHLFFRYVKMRDEYFLPSFFIKIVSIENLITRNVIKFCTGWQNFKFTQNKNKNKILFYFIVE